MHIFDAIFLGIVQGLTEFLPISSSAHLIVIPWMFGLEPKGLFFDVSLHVGTATAVLAYFRKDWVMLAREMIRGMVDNKILGNADRRLGWYIVVGTIPAVLAGLFLDQYIEESLRSPLVPVATLVLFGIVLYYADRRGRKVRSLEHFTWSDCLWIGIGQAIALIPGVSRSGITISVGLLRHIDRTSAARFSFLLSTPVILGAGVFEAWRVIQALQQPALVGDGSIVATTSIHWGGLMVGVAASAATGYLCIRYFLRYIQRKSFLPFVLYRFVLAALILLQFVGASAR
jgi:undecaprenyl-diphosphatase